MAEYTGWVNPADAKATPAVDWSSVIKGVTSKLEEQEAGREAKRQEQKKSTDELYKTLGDISAGQNQDINTFVTDGSYQAKNVINEAYKQYTSGKITGQEFSNIKDNVRKTFDDMKAVTTSWQADYGKFADAENKGVAGRMDEWNQMQRGKAMDLSNKGFYIDPKTGMGYVGDVKDGKIDLSTLQPPKWIKQNGSSLIGKVDVNTEAAKMTKTLGKYQEVMKNPPAGGIWTIESAAERPGFEEWLNKSADAIASDPLRMASILADNTSEYELTDDPNADMTNNILVQRDMKSGMNMPQLTKEQQRKAKDIVKNTILQQINQTIRQDENTYRPPAPRQTAPKQTTGAPKFTISPDTDNQVVYQTGINAKIGGTEHNLSEYGIGSDGKMYLVTERFHPLTGEPIVETIKEGDKKFSQFAGFIMNPETKQPYGSAKEAKAALKGGGSGSGSGTMTQAQWNAKWNKLSKGQSMVGLDGKTYTKQ